MRVYYITHSPPKPSHFTVLVRGIPTSTDEINDTVREFFTRYHGPSYLAHQMVYRAGKVDKIMVSNLIAFYSYLSNIIYLRGLGGYIIFS